MAKETCELIRKAMPAGRIPLGNGSRRAAISLTKQVLAFGTLELLSGSHVDPCQFRPRRNWAEKEWSNGTEFSGSSYFPVYWDNLARYTQIPKNVLSIRSPTRIFRNFWSNGKRPRNPTPKNHSAVKGQTLRLRR